MDPMKVREDFPFYQAHGNNLIYLDSACQSLRPHQVIQAMDDYYREYPACAGRSVHRLATDVTLGVDSSRERISGFLNAFGGEIVFTKNATESLNLVARGFPFEKGEVVLTTDLEHNNNHLPWMRCERERGIRREFIPTEEGMVDLESFKERMSDRVRMVSLVHTSNVTGTTVPAREIAEIAHDHGALVMLDGSQAAPHIPVDLKELDVDLYALSMHKMLGPSGMGILYGKNEVLEQLEPLLLGGGGVSLSGYEELEMLPPPDRFEAGLMNYSGILGSGAAVRYLQGLGMEEVNRHCLLLNRVVTEKMKDMPSVEIVGPEDPGLRGGILSFNVKGARSNDVAMLLDEMGGIQVRSGMHCAHPYFRSRDIPGSVRASFYVYNTREECGRFLETLEQVVRVCPRDQADRGA
ncbi:MAG: aminotransferase class V-fold PLP-dependent enzyme [Thermoplasmatota archaeon]